MPAVIAVSRLESLDRSKCVRSAAADACAVLKLSPQSHAIKLGYMAASSRTPAEQAADREFCEKLSNQLSGLYANNIEKLKAANNLRVRSIVFFNRPIVRRKVLVVIISILAATLLEASNET